MRNVFVTGASGLIGSHLVAELLSRSVNVVALVRNWNTQRTLIKESMVKNITVATGSLEDIACLERAIVDHAIDTVIHLGAQSLVGSAQRNPLAAFETNIRGTYNLLEACRRHEKQIRAVVVSSSDKAYGKGVELPYKEDHPLVGRNPYDVSKSCTDLLSSSYHHSFGLPVTIARCGNVFGGGDLNWSRIVPGTIRAYLHSESPVIRSDGTLIRDYFYVEDAVQAFLLLAESIENPEVPGNAFNFSAETKMSVLDIVMLLQTIMKVPEIEPEVLGSNKGEIIEQILDSQRAKTILGWKPKFAIDAALSHTVDWYREYFRNKK